MIGRILFRDGRPFCLSDRNNRPVLWLRYGKAGRLRTVYDRDGRGVTYRYREDRLSAVRDVMGKETRFAYDDKGRLSEVQGPGGKATRIAYSELGRVASVLDMEGEGHRFLWDYDQETSLYYVRIEDPSGKVTEIWSNKKGQARRVDINGRTVHRIEKQGRILIVTDGRGLVTRKTFDKKRNLLEIVHPDGATVKREYEPRFNRPIKIIDENGVETRFAYDEKGNLIQRTEATGTPAERITEYTYDGDGNILSTTQVGDERTKEAVTRYTYEAAGNRISKTGPEGHTTRYTYDTRGNVLTKTDPTGAEWHYAYDLAGRLTRTQDPLGHEIRFFYDADGQKVREIDPRGNETRYGYDDKGNLIRLTDALGNTTRFEYNRAGKLTRRIDPEGKESRYAYDTLGRVVSQKDGAGNETRMIYETPTSAACPTCGSGDAHQPARIVFPTFTKQFAYDKRGRRIEETDVLSENEAYSTLFDYDPAGNMILKTDKMGRTTVYAYDALSRLTRVVDPLSQETQYFYDDRNNLVELIDAKGRSTAFEYDRNNRLVKETRPMGEETIYHYDGAGNLAEKLDAKGQKTGYTYDDAGRLEEIRYYSSSDHTSPVKTVTFTYDAAGNLLTHDDGATSAEYQYDETYRKVSEIVDYGPFSKTVSYTYYDNGLKKTYTDPEGETYTYTYDDNNQLSEVRIPGHGSITYASYQWTRPESISFPGGSTKNYEYDPLMRVKRITSKAPGGNVLVDYDYTYDRMDNVTTKATEHGDYTYDYDDLYRLIEADNPTVSDDAFTYDPVGNRLTSAGTSGEWVYNPNNELEGYDGTTFAYDENGNTIRKTQGTKVTHYLYNEEDRLVQVEDGSNNIIGEYHYDPFGRRLWKEVDKERTYFVYSDEGLVGECDDTGFLTRSYGYVPGSTWTTDPIFLKEKNQYYFYHNDHLGTPHKMTSVNGAVVWSAKYSSFGKVEIEIETVENNLRFPGQYEDQESGLHYNRFRYYAPGTGVYLRMDPIRIQNIGNKYRYCIGNPVALYDPLGLTSDSVYKGVETPNLADFVKVINHFLSFFNAIDKTNYAWEKIYEIQKTIPCNEERIVWVCYTPGPPVRNVDVILGEGVIFNPKDKCISIPVRGIKDCKCPQELERIRKEREQVEIERGARKILVERTYEKHKERADREWEKWKRENNFKIKY